MMRLQEIVAAVCVVLSLVLVPVAVGWYHSNIVEGQYPEGTRVLNLTGFGAAGLWTLDRVDAGNYWHKEFQSATIYLEEGENVVLRLHSADVSHRFYAPALGVGPIDVEPGHLAVAQFVAPAPGIYEYFCTSMCGDCHFYMHGWVVVTAKGQTPASPPPTDCEHEYTQPPEGDMIARGRYLHQKLGCITCHGVDGKGGIANLNYAKDTIPAHNTLAESFHLEEQEEAQEFINLLLAGADLDSLPEEPDIPRFTLVRTQYEAAVSLIKNGKNCAKRDKDGPEPPRQMPSWQAFLSDHDIDCIIAYLLTLYAWEDDEY